MDRWSANSEILFLFRSLTQACHKKCISPKYKEGDLTKGESVCLDRCVAKYLDIHERIGKKLTAMSMQDEKLMSQLQGQPQQGKQWQQKKLLAYELTITDQCTAAMLWSKFTLLRKGLGQGQMTSSVLSVKLENTKWDKSSFHLASVC